MGWALAMLGYRRGGQVVRPVRTSAGRRYFDLVWLRRQRVQILTRTESLPT